MRVLDLRFLLFATTWAVVAESGLGQGTFQNLDFESGVFVPVGGSPVTVEAGPALPGWTPYIGTNQIDTVLRNTTTLSLASLSIYGPDVPQPGLFHGQYYVVLRAGDDIGQGRVPAALAQTGIIPGTAQSIQFYFAFGGITVFFGGQPIPLSKLGSSPAGYDIYGGDISAFAGQTGELRFQGGGYLDFIQFSNQVIPEPRTLGLFAFGALLLSWRWRRARKA